MQHRGKQKLSCVRVCSCSLIKAPRRHEELGELRVRTPRNFPGYFEDDAVTKQPLDLDGFSKTGDIFGIEKKKGFLYVVDRRKELI